jgi:hypothetical protein
MIIKLHLKRALVLFAAAYIIVTILAVTISITYGILANLPEPPPGTSPVKAPVFLATVPYHVLVMLIIWPIFAAFYFKKSPKRNPAQQKQETFRLALLWLALAMIVDYVVFVLIKTPFSLTFYQFYVDYQPWISLIYLAIFLSPWIRLGVVGLGKAEKNTGR